MGHYKSNLRDIEFNLFEVLGRDKLYGTGPFEEMDTETAKKHPRRADPPRGERAGGVLHRRRPQPPGLRPGHQHRARPGVLQEELPAFMDSEYWRLGLPEAIGGTTAPPSLIWPTPN